jgi:hypothetical protein
MTDESSECAGALATAGGHRGISARVGLRPATPVRTATMTDENIALRELL